MVRRSETLRSVLPSCGGNDRGMLTGPQIVVVFSLHSEVEGGGWIRVESGE